MAVAGEGYFLGGVLLAPLLAWSVSPDNLGWRETALWMGVAFLVVAWPVSSLVRDRPEPYGQLPDGGPGPARAPSPVALAEGQQGPASTPAGPQFTARQAIRTSAFWYITFGHALSSMLIAAMTVHLVPMLTDQGMSLQMAAYVWAVVMAVGAVAQLVGGYLGDRMPVNAALFIFTTIQAAGFAMAVVADSTAMAFGFAVVFGVGLGGRNPLTMVIRGAYFGQRAFATITGISMVPLYVFMLLAPLFAALLYDARKSYDLAFLVLAGLGLLSGILFLLARKPTARPAP
jgi:cyanate permease